MNWIRDLLENVICSLIRRFISLQVRNTGRPCIVLIASWDCNRCRRYRGIDDRQLSRGIRLQIVEIYGMNHGVGCRIAGQYASGLRKRQSSVWLPLKRIRLIKRAAEYLLYIPWLWLTTEGSGTRCRRHRNPRDGRGL